MSPIIQAALSAIPCSLVQALAVLLKENADQCARALDTSVLAVAEALSAESHREQAVQAIFKIVDESGFDAEAMGRLGAMNVSRHLNELLAAGSDMARTLLHSQLEVIASKVAAQHGIKSESAILIISAVTVFILASLGNEVSRRSLSAAELLPLLKNLSEDSAAVSKTAPAQKTIVPTEDAARSRVLTSYSPQSQAIIGAGIGSGPPPFSRWNTDNDPDFEEPQSRGVSRWVWAGSLVGVIVFAGILVRSSWIVGDEVRAERSLLASAAKVPFAGSDTATDTAAVSVEVPPSSIENDPASAGIGISSGDVNFDEVARAAMDPVVLDKLEPQEDAITAAVPVTEAETESVNAAVNRETAPPPALGTAIEVAVSEKDPSPIAESGRTQVLPNSAVVDSLAALLGSSEKLSRSASTFELQGVEFKPGRAELASDLPASISQIAELLAKYPRARAQVMMVADETGAAHASVGLAQLRAEFLKTQIVKAGVSRGRIDSKGTRAAEGEAASSEFQSLAGRAYITLLRK